MTSNITLTSVDSDAQMDLVLTRLYFLVIDNCIIDHNRLCTAINGCTSLY